MSYCLAELLENIPVEFVDGIQRPLSIEKWLKNGGFGAPILCTRRGLSFFRQEFVVGFREIDCAANLECILARRDLLRRSSGRMAGLAPRRGPARNRPELRFSMWSHITGDRRPPAHGPTHYGLLCRMPQALHTSLLRKTRREVVGSGKRPFLKGRKTPAGVRP